MPKQLELLIYIPCHTDFQMAINNAQRIRQQFFQLGENTFEIELALTIVISVNGVALSEIEISELEAVSDELIRFNEVLGDTNINQGFLEALKRKPDYFWILSANEILVKESLKQLFSIILVNPLSDIFVTNERNRNSTHMIKNIFLDVPSGTALGLISGVIYKFSTTHPAFPAGPRFGWTGWGQLAVIQSACANRGEIRITEIPDNLIYQTPFTDLRGRPKSTEFEVVRKGYAHSYFGMVVLVYSLFPRDLKTQKQILRGWLRMNWYKLNYFKIGSEHNVDLTHPFLNSLWIQKTAVSILYKTGFRSLFLTTVGLNLSIEKWKSNSLAIRIKKQLIRK